MKNKIPQEIEENRKMCSNWYEEGYNDGFKAGQKQNLDFTDGFREGRLYERKKVLKLIEDLQKKVRRMLIDNSKCDCTEWTTRYGDISDVCFWEFISKIGDNSEVKK